MKEIIHDLLNRQFEKEGILSYLSEKGFNKEDALQAFQEVIAERNQKVRTISKRNGQSGFLFLIIGLCLLALGSMSKGSYSTFLIVLAIINISFGIWAITRPLRDES